MPLVEFRPSGKKIIVADTLTISEAASRAGLTVELPCGGEGVCGRCLVIVEKGAVVNYAQPPGGAPANAALACRTAVGAADCVFELPVRDLASEDRLDEPALEGELFPGFMPDAMTGGALVELISLSVPPPLPEAGGSDVDQTNQELMKNITVKRIDWGRAALAALPEALRSGASALDLLFFRKNDWAKIISARGLADKTVAAGVAIDLGTTTVSVKIHDIQNGKQLAAATGYNEQIHCGEDIISRINYAHSEVRLSELRAKALTTINRLVALAAKSVALSPSDIHCAVISGNTVMTHLLLGITAEYLRRSPYVPALLSVPWLNAAELGMAINPSGLIYFSPAAGSYVGGDITAGLLCTDMDVAEEIALFIDVGTNGEIVLGNRDFLMACACSAGPAFEGGGIGCGMRALPGAVQSVRINPATGLPITGVIGGGKARGICGSGMIELISGLFLQGLIDPAGRFCPDVRQNDACQHAASCRALEYDGKRPRYRLVDAANSISGKPLYITEPDIENIIRAKAAVFSASALLLANAGVTWNDIARVYVAGGFGRRLDIASAINIGLLPDVPAARFSYLGNASLSGSSHLLLSQGSRDRQAATTKRLTYINLSAEPGYASQYTAALFLPHTDIRLFPQVQKRLHMANMGCT